MQASRRLVRINRHEWALKSPAHHTEIAKAVAVAVHESEALERGSDVQISARDEEVVVWFEAEQPPTAAKQAADRV